MIECELMNKCKFIDYYKDQNRIVIQGFIRKYCSEKKDSNKCIRKRLLNILEDSDEVPINMMPNGLCYPGTDKSGWASEMKKYYFTQKEG